MGIENIGVSFLGSSSSESKAGVRVFRGDDPSVIYVKWTTQSGTDWQKSFDVAADVSGVPRGLTGAGDYGYGDAKGFWTNFAASECKPVKRADGLWQWCAPLDLGDIGDGELLDVFGPWGFSSRTQDALRVDLRLKANYVDGKTDAWGRTYSDVEYATAWVGWFPSFSLKRAYFTTSAVVIEFTSPEWERMDDRWAVEKLEQGGSSLLARNFSWGNVRKSDGVGRIEVPMGELSRTPAAGSIEARIRINTVFRDAGEDFVTFSGTVALEDMTKCSTPSLALAWEGTGLRAEVRDRKDRTPSLTSCLVKISGSEWGFDQAYVAPGSSALLPFPPLGTPVTVSAMGFGPDGTVNPGTSSTIAAQATDAALLEEIGGECGVEGIYDVELAWDGDRSVETVKLEGRERPVAWFGNGGEAKMTMRCSIVDEGGDGSLIGRAAENLLTAGPCMLRTQDGERRVVAVEGVSLSSAAPPRWIRDASFTMSEVDYD